MPAKEVVAASAAALSSGQEREHEMNVSQPAGGERHRGWRTIDIVTTAVIAVVSGVVFWAWGSIWNLTGPLFTWFPPAQALLYGVWLVPGVLGMLVVRRPGAAVATAFLAAAVSWLLGGWWGLSVLWYGVLQGLAPEVVFSLGRYRLFNRAISISAGAAAGAVPGFLDPIFWYPEWSATWKVVYLAACMVSAAVIAGLGSHVLSDRLARAGALDAFPLGRERLVG
jgi:energy-coupling factor transport system substrate-specific component